MGYIPTETNFHEVINLGKQNIAVNASALYAGKDNQFAQTILKSIDFQNEANHKVYQHNTMRGTVRSDSTNRKDIAYIHSKYADDIRARNAEPMSEGELLNRLISDVVQSNKDSKKSIDFLRGSMGEGVSDEE